jgi:hypothetical protein
MQNNINPNFIIQQMMKNPNLANNQLAQNALQMYQNGDKNGLNEMMNNLCRERGVTRENMEKQIRSMFGM